MSMSPQSNIALLTRGLLTLFGARAGRPTVRCLVLHLVVVECYTFLCSVVLCANSLSPWWIVCWRISPQRQRDPQSYTEESLQHGTHCLSRAQHDSGEFSSAQFRTRVDRVRRNFSCAGGRTLTRRHNCDQQ